MAKLKRECSALTPRERERGDADNRSLLYHQLPTLRAPYIHHHTTSQTIMMQHRAQGAMMNGQCKGTLWWEGGCFEFEGEDYNAPITVRRKSHHNVWALVYDYFWYESMLGQRKIYESKSGTLLISWLSQLGYNHYKTIHCFKTFGISALWLTMQLVAVEINCLSSKCCTPPSVAIFTQKVKLATLGRVHPYHHSLNCVQ